MKTLASIGIGFAICWLFFREETTIQVMPHNGTHWCHPVMTQYVAWKEQYYYINQEPDKIFFYNLDGYTIALYPCAE